MTEPRPPVPRLLASPYARAVVPLVLVLLVGCIFHRDGAFFAWQTHRAMLREISVHGILACGMTVVIITGGIDLSVSSVLALGAVAFALLSFSPAVGAGAAVAIVLAAGLLAGATSGWLVARFRIQPFVATLAMMVFARGLAKLLSGGKKVTAARIRERRFKPPCPLRAPRRKGPRRQHLRRHDRLRPLCGAHLDRARAAPARAVCLRGRR